MRKPKLWDSELVQDFHVTYDQKFDFIEHDKILLF